MVPPEVERLPGGNWTRIVERSGDVVRRTPSPPFSIQVLRFLARAGFPHAPRYLGRSDDDLDLFGYIPGATTDHPGQRAEGAYAAGALMLRSLHDMTKGTVLAGRAECVIHGDAGPYNTIFRQGLPVAFVDWDSCRPGRRRDDLAYFAWTWCILAVPDVAVEDQARRLASVYASYALPDASPIDDVIASQTTMVDAWSEARRRARDEAEADRHAAAVAWAEASLNVIRDNLATFRRAL